MKHDITIEGIAFKLRPVEIGDASQILALRGNSDLNRFISPTPRSITLQKQWIANYFTDESDYYFVVESLSNGSFEGLIALYKIDYEKSEAEWGRWIVKPGSLSSIESVMLILNVAFGTLGLKKIYSRTVANNLKVVSFHDSLGCNEKKILPYHYDLSGQIFDAVEHSISQEEWPEIHLKLNKLSKFTAARIHENG